MACINDGLKDGQFCASINGSTICDTNKTDTNPYCGTRNGYPAFLDSLGVEVVSVESGNKCLESAFDTNGDGYDMIILDSHLNDIGGLDLARRIHERMPNQRIVLTTTLPLSQISNVLNSTGINQEDVLLKPFKFSTLLSVIKPRLMIN